MGSIFAKFRKEEVQKSDAYMEEVSNLKKQAPHLDEIINRYFAKNLQIENINTQENSQSIKKLTKIYYEDFSSNEEEFHNMVFSKISEVSKENDFTTLSQIISLLEAIMSLYSKKRKIECKKIKCTSKVLSIEIKRSQIENAIQQVINIFNRSIDYSKFVGVKLISPLKDHETTKREIFSLNSVAFENRESLLCSYIKQEWDENLKTKELTEFTDKELYDNVQNYFLKIKHRIFSSQFTSHPELDQIIINDKRVALVTSESNQVGSSRTFIFYTTFMDNNKIPNTYQINVHVCENGEVYIKSFFQDHRDLEKIQLQKS